MVYTLARHLNQRQVVIPESTMSKAPSAELRPNQTDQDTLPPYDLLDAILYRYIDEGLSEKDIINQGFDVATTQWVILAIKKNEYKRRQAAPGLKVTSKAFGMGRRVMLTSQDGQ